MGHVGQEALFVLGRALQRLGLFVQFGVQGDHALIGFLFCPARGQRLAAFGGFVLLATGLLSFAGAVARRRRDE